MTTNTHARPILAHDSVGSGPLALLLPGAGDLRSEYRFLAPLLAEAGYRVVTADLPGHGESSTVAGYGVANAAQAILDLIDHLDAGPATLIACSFAPAAGIWAATERPEAFSGMVMMSPHLEGSGAAAEFIQRIAMGTLLRGPWAPALWNKFYRSWYPTNPPADLDSETEKIRDMMSEPQRRKAIRETLVAHRDGMSGRIDKLDVRSLVIFGTADSHFKDPAGEAEQIAKRTGAQVFLAEGAGHYPHVERTDVVGPRILEFLSS